MGADRQVWLLSVLVVVFTLILVEALRQLRQRSLLRARILTADAASGRMHAKVPIDRKQVEWHMPNALDLMRVCIDAGLGLNASMGRVGAEFRSTCPSLATLFSNVQLQLSAGATRDRAFETFVTEIGSAEVRNLMMSLAEAERLGSSMSAILKTYSAELRMRRQLRAEEYGAKLPTKLLFPMLLCLFPAMLVVLAGPSIISALELVKMLR
jgi:tight adherence protein C